MTAPWPHDKGRRAPEGLGLAPGGPGTTALTRIVVSYNSAAMLPWQAKASAALPTLVVDNGSTDGSVRIARALGHEVLALDENHGFGRGVMAGLEAVGSGLALVMNPDAAMGARAVAELAAAAERHPDCDLFMPRLTDSRGRIFFRHESGIERRVRDRVPPTGTTCVPMISGAVMLIRVEPFLARGGFDPAIFLYFEDDDLALRYRAERRPLIYVPAAQATHLRDRSSGTESRASEVKDLSYGWSAAYLMGKHGRGWRGLVLAGLLLKLPVYALGGRWGRLRRQWGRIRGFLRALGGRPAPFLPEGPPRGTRLGPLATGEGREDRGQGEVPGGPGQGLPEIPGRGLARPV